MTAWPVLDGGGGMGLKIALISRDNGVGLSLDVQLLTDLFLSAGHEVSFHDWHDPVMDHADIAFHLELVSRTLAQHADKNVGLLNLEWYPLEWVKYLPAFDQIWAKSEYAARFCRQHGARSEERRVGKEWRSRWSPEQKKEQRHSH